MNDPCLKAQEHVNNSLVNDVLPENCTEGEKALLTGIMHFYKEEIAEAVIYLDQAVELDPENREARLIRGICNLKLGTIGKAEKDFDLYAKGEEDKAESFNCIGKLLYVYGCYEEAEKYFRVALSHDPKNAAIFSNLGSIMVELGRMDEAKAYFVKATELDPNLSEAQTNLGMFYFILRDFNAAEHAFLRALELDREQDVYDPVVYANLGDLYYAMGEVDPCIQAYTIALDLDPKMNRLRTRFGLAWLAKHEPDMASEQFELAIQEGDAPSDAHYYLGSILLGRGQVFEAMSEYRKAIQRSDFSDPMPMIALADILARMERNPEALRLYEMAFQLGERSPRVLALLSRLSELNHDAAKAIDYYRLLDDGNNPGFAVLLEVARRCAESRLEEIRDPVRAIAITRQLTENMERRHPGVLDVMASGYAGLGDYQQASKFQSQAIEALPQGNPIVATLMTRLREYEVKGK